MTTPIESQGVVLEISDMASTPVWTEIANIESFDGPQGSANEIPTTSLSSTRHEFLMGLPDEGPLRMTVFYNPSEATHVTLRSLRNSRSENDFRITWTDTGATTESFSAYVQEYARQAQVDDAVRANVTLRITDEITIST